MTFALLGNTGISGGSGGGSSGSVDTTGADLIIIHVSQYTVPATITPSDSKGNTWTGLTVQAGGTENKSRLWYCINPTVGTGHTFTATGSNTFSCAQVAWFSGAAAAGFDQQNGAVAVGTATTLQTGSVTPSQNDELVVTGLSADRGNTLSINASFTITNQYPYSAGSREAGALAYLIQTTAGAVNPTWTTDVSAPDMAATIATFKAAGGGGSAFIPIIGRGPGMALVGSSGLVA